MIEEMGHEPTMFEMAHVLGLTRDLFPLDEMKAPKEVYNNWSDWIVGKGCEVDSPISLIAEYPLTIYWILKEIKAGIFT